MLRPLTCYRILILLFLALCFANGSARAFEGLKPISKDQLKTIENVEIAVDQIQNALDAAQRKDQLTFALQKQSLDHLGLCISTLVSFQNGKAHDKVDIYSKIRSVCKQIIVKNEKIISFYQEHKLDAMKDPSAFFKTPEWQNPQFLISLASYWTGWNGYYGSLGYSDKEPQKKEMLNEAVKGFSRAVIDFEEEDVILRSLLGRAMCHTQLKAYDKAKRDFSAVKRKVGENHPLSIRCLYEENRILYLTGNLESALRELNEIGEDVPDDQIPPELSTGFDRLKSKVILALLEKKQQDKISSGKPDNLLRDPLFKQLKQLAQKAGGVKEFYRYAGKNIDRLKQMSYGQLGPVASMGLADAFFETKDYEKALGYYLPILSDSPEILQDQMDGIYFRTGYIFCKKERWKDAVSTFAVFIQTYPESEYFRKVVPLYFLAASHYHKSVRSEKAYEQFIESAEVYTKHCTGNCPELSEAHFQLGQYHEKRRNTKRAVKEFMRVGADSPNVAIAKYHLLKHYLNRLEELRNTGQIPSNESDGIIREGLEVAKAYQNMVTDKKQTPSIKRLSPNMVILGADLLTFDTKNRCEEILTRLNKFEIKYPHETKLFLKVFRLRISCYADLGKLKQLKTEIKGFFAAGPISKSRYDTLRDSANHCYYQAEKSRKKNSLEVAKKYGQAAMIMYHHLYQLSCDHSEFQNNRDAIQLRMAQICVNDNRLDHAEELYKDILQRNSLSADAYYSLGLLYEKTAQWEDALQTWRRFSDGVSDGTYHWYESRYKIAQAHMKLGNTKKACEILTITMVLHPDFGNKELMDKYQSLKAENCEETR